MPPSVRIPHVAPGTWPEPIAASRFASRIRRDSPEGCGVAILGLADDLGVRLNNGRPGAKEGPLAFRAALARYGVAEPYGWEWPAVYDAGDVIPAEGEDEAALHETHRRVTEATAAILDLGLFPIGIGGGHDLTFPFVRAVAERHRHMAAIYFDAHLDVRETVGSGMPFRSLVTQCDVYELHNFGFNPLANSREHVAWFKGQRGEFHRMSHPDRLEGGRGVLRQRRHAFLSFDLDVLDSAIAPGVSAPNPAGWSVIDASRHVYALAKSEELRCFDIMELNPRHDADDRTARAAVHVCLWFLRGLLARAAGPS